MESLTELLVEVYGISDHEAGLVYQQMLDKNIEQQVLVEKVLLTMKATASADGRQRKVCHHRK